ncbi:hypothetical protein M0R45_019349 [Rubus argutus]|uniref:Uncharacterized protein n=1 Tax=Rubus argutus TaxID=59490 RepID=A0AAW1X7M9_RUBAR
MAKPNGPNMTLLGPPSVIKVQGDDGDDNGHRLIHDIIIPPELDLPQCMFPDDIQTYFDCQDSTSYGEVDDAMFSELNSFIPSMFQCDFTV